MMDVAWTSRDEEQLAALFFIASMLAFGNGFRILGWALLAKALLDVVCAVALAVDNRKRAALRQPDRRDG